jgi:hypothetical protein
MKAFSPASKRSSEQPNFALSAAAVLATSWQIAQRLGQRGWRQPRSTGGVFVFAEGVLDLLGARVE